MRLWLGNDFVVPVALQLPFALALTISACSDIAVNLVVRLSDDASRTRSIITIVSALLNLGLSIWAAAVGWLAGIAWATVVTQTFSSLACAALLARVAEIPWVRLARQAWLIPVTAVFCAGFARFWLDCRTPGGFAAFAAVVCATLSATALVSGLAPGEIFREFRALFAAFRAKKE
jgi:hypothetical protein